MTNHKATLSGIRDILVELLREKGKDQEDLDLQTPLYETGLGFDSLDTATFSAMLEQRFGTDPYSAGAFPQNIAEVVSFYSLDKEEK